MLSVAVLVAALGKSVLPYPRLVVSSVPRADVASAALEHVDALYRLALRMTRKKPDAEDLVQETYARALGATDQFELGTNVRAWMFRILRNVHIDALRRSRVSPITDAAHAVERGVHDDEPARADLEAALSALSVDARTIILLDLEGFTETELAMVFECPLGTVKSRLARARATLRERLKDYAR